MPTCCRRMKWLNFGGRTPHHPPRLCPCYTGKLHPVGAARSTAYRCIWSRGEAWALNAGYLVTTVLDTLRNGDTSLAILDMSAACHTPDVIEMPYRPPLLDAGEAGEKPHTVRLGGPTCLAGDIIGDYSFDVLLLRGIGSSSAIWPSTPPARTTPSTACPCRPSGCWAQTAIAGSWCTSVIRTSKCAWAHSKIKSVCHGLRAATNAFFMKGVVKVNGR